jgi:hypothetical protein
MEQLEDRQHEGCGLASPRLCSGEHIAVGEDVRDRIRLDGRGLGVALGLDGAKELGQQPEGFE